MELLNRNEVKKEVCWDLTPVYKSEEDFLNELKETKEKIHAYQKYEGHTMENAHTFYESIVDGLEITRKLEKLYAYASLKSDEDVSNNHHLENKQKVFNLSEELNQVMYFKIPELLEVDYSKIETFYQEEPRLKEYEKDIRDSYRYKSHTLSKKEEELFSTLTKGFGNAEDTYGILTDSDMTFGTIHDEEGNVVELTDTNYTIYISSKKESVRKEAFFTLYKHYAQYKNTISSLMYGNVKERIAEAHARKYSSAFEASLFEDEMDPKVYETLVNTIHENLPVLHQYYDLKKEVLNLKELHLYDVFVEMSGTSKNEYPFEKGKELVLNALSIFGEDYISHLKNAFTQKWIDIYPNKNKRGGGYSGGSYDTYPYILLNYQNKIDDVSTLAHELGHSMHSYYTRENNPYQYGDYPIFVAEVASTVNELLLAKYMLKNSTDKQEKLSILNHLLELFKATIYRQVMFAEFEKYAYDLVEQEEVITSQKLCEKYLKLNQEYFGPRVNVESEIQYEWEKIPHLYYGFYLYKYATGLSAACKIVTGILNKEPHALENYLNMLKNGSKANPLDTLLIAGVDMKDKSVYESAIQMFQDTISEFQEVYRS